MNNIVTTDFDFAKTFAWVVYHLSGNNLLENILPFDEKAKDLSDDGFTLRYAYGPRMRSWIGADHIVEMQKKNKGLVDHNMIINGDKASGDSFSYAEEVSKFKKPIGVDQIGEAYENLKNGERAIIQIYDPAIDTQKIRVYNAEKDCFEMHPSKSVPNTLAFLFIRRNKELDFVKAISRHCVPIQDIFLSFILAHMFADWCGYARKFDTHYPLYYKLFDNCKFPSPKDTWMILNSIFDFSKHLISATRDDYINNPEIPVEKLVLDICNQFIGKIIDLDKEDEEVGRSIKYEHKRIRYKNFEWPTLLKDGCYSMAVLRLMKLHPIYNEQTIYELIDKIESLDIKALMLRDYLGYILVYFKKNNLNINNSANEYNFDASIVVDLLYRVKTEIDSDFSEELVKYYQEKYGENK